MLSVFVLKDGVFHVSGAGWLLCEWMKWVLGVGCLLP